MTLNPNDPNVATAVLGEEVAQWLREDIGSYVLERAKRQSEAATEELKAVDPFEPEKIVALQMRIKVADSIMEWLGDAVHEGLQARRMLEEG